MVRVTSEIGRVRRVLVHEPGIEVDNMVPSMMEELLFDDILYGDRARDEHARFRRVLQLFGIEVPGRPRSSASSPRKRTGTTGPDRCIARGSPGTLLRVSASCGSRIVTADFGRRFAESIVWPRRGRRRTLHDSSPCRTGVSSGTLRS